MFCKNCGEKIVADDKFCPSCGFNLIKSGVDTKNDDSKKDFANAIWNKFLEIVKADGKEKDKYQQLSSDVTFELISRLYTNAFNELAEEFRIDLDKQQYKSVEAIKNNLLSFALSSYQVYIAEKLLRDGTFKKAKITDADVLAKEWGTVHLNFANKITIIPQDVITVLDAIEAQIGEKPFNDNPSLKELPKAVVDAIKNKAMQQLINGYLLGIAENNIREKTKE